MCSVFQLFLLAVITFFELFGPKVLKQMLEHNSRLNLV